MTRKIELGHFMLPAGIPVRGALVFRALSQETKASLPVAGAPRLSSGAMIECRNREFDRNKAKPVKDKRSVPTMIDPVTGVKVSSSPDGEVRSAANNIGPQQDRIYWMVSANPGNVVKPSSLVNVKIGNFRVDGLVAQ